MSKESSLTKGGKVLYGPLSTKTGPNDLTRHPGKTKRDHASGAWDNHLANRAAKADENRGSITKKN